MGLDLTLIVITGDYAGNTNWLGLSMLATHRQYDVYDAIRELERVAAKEVSSEFSTYLGRLGEEYLGPMGITLPYDDVLQEAPPCYGITQETPYGEWIHYVEAKPLVDAIEQGLRISIDKEGLAADSYICGPWGPVLGYLRGCRPEQKIALYWH